MKYDISKRIDKSINDEAHKLAKVKYNKIISKIKEGKTTFKKEIKKLPPYIPFFQKNYYGGFYYYASLRSHELSRKEDKLLSLLWSKKRHKMRMKYLEENK